MTTISRRAMLKTMAGAALAARAGWLRAADGDFNNKVLAYVNSLKRGDAYGWDDLEEPNLTSTWAAIGALTLLGQKPSDPAKLAAFVRADYPQKGASPLRIYDFQQVQALRWLGDEAADKRATVAEWVSPKPYPAQYEQHTWPVFHNQMTAFTCRELLGMPLSDIKPEFVKYIEERRRANGSFNGTPASDGGDGHVMNTLWALEALKTLGKHEEKKKETADWLRSCQMPGGGFNWAPKPPFGGGDDVAYTRAAVVALALLGEKPADPAGCVKYIFSLWNEDGGFADRPGWLSNPAATYYALDALAALGELDKAGKALPAGVAPKPLRARKALPAGLKIFSIQLESHGQGSPAEAVDLAQSLKIDFWGAKNAKPEWMDRVRAIAKERGAAVQFFTANEEYGTFIHYEGFGTYSHTSDIFSEYRADIGPSLAGPDVVSYEDYRTRRLAPLMKGGGRVFWQFGENEELTRALLDDSIARGGYAAISTFHFGNPDFLFTEAFLHRWRGQIPYVGIQDAHGNEPWWFSDMTEGYRTLFLAPEPTWEGWLTALKNNWVMAVRHDAVTGGRTRMHAGSPEVLEFVKAREAEWRWWDNPKVKRPAVSIVALKPADELEAGRPERGIALRVRCQWENTTNGQPKNPRTEFVSLTVDGKKVEAQEVKKGRAPKMFDVYHLYPMDSPAPGKHTAKAVVREIASGKEIEREIEFTA